MDAVMSGMPDAARFVVAFILVLGLIAAAALIWRRFGGSVLMTTTGARGRQPRLAVIDAAPVDGKRRLVLIRRDNTEHLLMIGGPTDIVVEPNIVRGANAGSRESRPLPTGDLPARLVDGPAWSPLGEIPRPRMTEAVETIRLEPMTVRPEPPRAETLRTEPRRPESVRTEPVRPEAVRPEPTGPDATIPEAVRLEPDRQDDGRQDDGRQEAARQDAMRQEAIRLELRQEATRRETSRQEAARQEAMRQEAMRGEDSRMEPAQLEQPRPVRERMAADSVRMSRVEPAFRPSPQPGAIEKSRSDFDEEGTRVMSFREQTPQAAEAPEPMRLAPTAPTSQAVSRTPPAPAPIEAMPASPEARRTPADPLMPAVTPIQQPVAHESDFVSPAQPQRAPPPAAPREGAFQSTGVIRESPQPRAMPARPTQTDESNLAEMAQRLEVALRRPTKPVDVSPAPPVYPVARIEPFAPPVRPSASAPPATPAPRVAASFEPPAAVPAPGARSSQPAPVSDLRADPRMRPAPEAPAPFESLEEEMANLLGRATGKT
jgi:flagellar protein FliO/FliZ